MTVTALQIRKGSSGVIVPSRPAIQPSRDPANIDVFNPAVLDSQIVPTGSGITKELLDRHANHQRTEVQNLSEVEAHVGKSVHPKVMPEQFAAWDQHRIDAYVRFSKGIAARALDSSCALGIVSAPTSRVVDHMVDSRGLAILINRIQREGKLEELQAMIKNGPSSAEQGQGPHGNQAWQDPDTPLKLLASIVRMTFLNHGAKKRMRVSAELRNWIAETLREANYDTVPRIGAMGGLATAMATAIHHRAMMMSRGNLASAISKHLPEDTLVIGDDPAHRTLKDLPKEKDPGNFYFELKGHGSFFPPTVPAVFIGDKCFDPCRGRDVDIVLTGVPSVTGFSGLSLERMETVAQENDLLMLSGLHVLNSQTEIDDYFKYVGLFNRHHKPVALCYSETRFPEREAHVWKTLCENRAVQFLGLNSLEGFGILKRLLDSSASENPLGISGDQAIEIKNALSQREMPHPIWGSEQESPEWTLQCADILQKVLKIPLVRVRARACDVLVADSAVQVFDPDHVRDSQLISRQEATIKAASPRGIPSNSEALAFIANVPAGKHMAALHMINDSILGVCRELAADHAQETLPYCGYSKLSDGRMAFVVPPVPLYSQRGRAAGAGDVMDFIFASEQAYGLLKAACFV